MSEQVWTVKKAQDLVPGNLIAGVLYALCVKSVDIQGDKVTITVNTDLWKRLTRVHLAKKDQPIPTAVSGVAHMDLITADTLTQEKNDAH